MNRLTLPRIPETIKAKHYRTGRLVALVGALIAVASIYLPWSYGSEPLDNMTYLGGPSPLQFAGGALALIVALMLVGAVVSSRLTRVKGRTKLLHRVAWNRAARAGALGLLAFVVVVLASIALTLGGLVNVEYGGWVALAGSALAVLGTRLLSSRQSPSLERAPHVPVLEIVTIAVVLLGGLMLVSYALNQRDGDTFIVLLVHLAAMIVIAARSGLGTWLAVAGQRHRKVLVFSAFAVAFLFPFTQNGSDENMSIATQVLIFAATAVGLNIVVGLAGLLDLGYIAFLGAGAYVAAVLSRSAYATFDIHPPFIVVVLVSGLVAATLGLIIGSPTLRVSGDYLAIVTLAFGEIFRITMSNLDGTDGPNITRGASGIPGIPNLKVFGFDFGAEHVVAGITLGRFANYFFLMLIVMALIIWVFTRLNYSRIGRGWVAIREDEKAAEAMGVNVFGLKLLAFAGGAFLAGLAGSVKAHVDTQATPEQYVFLESAFLLAAVVLGGMGTVLGVIVGAVLLKLVPEKLRFLSEFRMLGFGLLMVLMMRFRPEGMIPNSRRQLEFHTDDQDLADEFDDDLPYEFVEERA
ncbi:branched-chain amino acid ABC transporter permease [Aestuariimicrobium soli]|uniref:branched-chain amino acid ABC transporter permease n=1 Tax=Aestuariimicrobium soli TaxID=2035834 RepID=UPI003EBC45ED